MSRWKKLSSEFLDYHRHPLNIALHLVTTPAALYAFAAILGHLAGALAVWTATAAWLLALGLTVPTPLWLASAGLLGLIAHAAVASSAAGSFSVTWTVGLFGAAYILQDVAHWVTGEPTFQESYLGKRPGWVITFLDHTHHLVPLCIDACWQAGVAALFVQRRQVVKGHLRDHPELMAALRSVGSWAVSQKTPRSATTHWWWYDLGEATESFRVVARSPAVMDMFSALFPPKSHVVRPLEGMNELYVAAEHRGLSSDHVFYLDHVDGPLGIFPLVHVYRCMCACTPNGEIETIFPMEGGDSRCTLSTGDIVGFDFHRELHRIAPVAGGAKNDGQRICLKLHYCVYPRALAPLGLLLGALTTKYNQTFRQLFVATITPTSWIAKVNAALVIFGTRAFNSLEAHIGWGNLAIYATLGAVATLARSYSVFFYATSYLHYLVYISTYSYRQPCGTRIAFGAFKRDVLLFKSLALLQATVQYLTLPTALSYQPHALSLGLIVCGFGLGALATAALGIDRTYFGWELGQVGGDYVQRFPYGAIPHPMILGGMVGWLGFHALPAFRAAHPYYAPLHVALYAAHALQEHASVHTTGLLARSC